MYRIASEEANERLFFQVLYDSKCSNFIQYLDKRNIPMYVGQRASHYPNILVLSSPKKILIPPTTTVSISGTPTMTVI